MKTIFITVLRGGTIRNFFRTGIIKGLLEKNFKVIILTPYHDVPGLFDEFKHEQLFIEQLIIPKKEKFRRLLYELRKGVVFNDTVHSRYKYRIGGKQPKKIFYPFRLLFFAPLRFIPGARSIIRWLDSTINPKSDNDHLFKKHHPDIVFNTATSADQGILRKAKELGITTIDMPKSWDNLSKALLRVKADFLIVWSPFMRTQATKLHGYKYDEVIVTGIPQFDFYVKKNGLLSREEFCKKHRFDPRKKIILYGSAGANLFDEFQNVFLIQKFMDEGKLVDANILVRPHLAHRGDKERYLVLEKDTRIVVDKSDKQNHALRDNYDTSQEHVYNLFNSMYHADVCINAASTLTLDATACGTPVINVNFDVNPVSHHTESVNRLYYSDYIRYLMSMNGTWFAKSKEEFLQALKDVLEDGKKKETQKMIDQFIYKVDGMSAQRVVDAVIRIADKS